ncbi:hypothetical protein BDW02DRAFT_583156 [Decorospora gaudefroyi]|uniref:Uncharacterized protein n=1 Tax=Decorospora gaudefroyi TaxID=184978 RepID=A0A6A5K6L5_9PLEO|nr:hypothetical protein BDW02DRAFT_583156 [Decorospora gaudefroyi]
MSADASSSLRCFVCLSAFRGRARSSRRGGGAQTTAVASRARDEPTRGNGLMKRGRCAGATHEIVRMVAGLMVDECEAVAAPTDSESNVSSSSHKLYITYSVPRNKTGVTRHTGMVKSNAITLGTLRIVRDRARRTLSMTMDAYVDKFVDKYHLNDAPNAPIPLPTSVLKLTNFVKWPAMWLSSTP